MTEVMNETTKEAVSKAVEAKDTKKHEAHEVESVAESIRGLADRIQAATTLDLSDLSDGKAVATTSQGEWDGIVDQELVARGLNKDHVKQVVGLMVDLSSANTLALGRLSKQAMDEHPSLQRTSIKNTGIDFATEASYTRKKAGVTRDVAWTKYGSTTTNVTVGVGRSGAHTRQVQNYLQASAEKDWSETLSS